VRLTRSAVIVAVIGVLALVAAAVVKFGVVPSASKLPTDLNTTQNYSGAYNGLNPAALAGGGGNLLLRDVPVTASRNYTVDSTDGNTAVVNQKIERAVGGQASPTATTKYAVDRTDFQSAPAPSGAKDVVPSKGWIFTLPLHPQTDGKYQLWDATTGAAYPLAYKGTSTLDGRTVLKYQSVAKGKVADPQALGLPTSVTKAQVAGLQPVLAGLLPPAVLAQLPAVLAKLPDSLALTYTSDTTSTIYADSEIGSPIKSGSTQKISANLVLGATVAVPFTTIDLNTTAKSSQAMADDASSKAGTLNLVGTVLPIGLTVLGVVLLLVALLMAIRAGRSGGSAGAQPPTVPTPAHV
jgi:hypothetical protein